jgi:hypothetical protein
LNAQFATDDYDIASDEGECRRELLREALAWLVALHRVALPVAQA